MAKLIGEYYESNGVKVSWWDQGDELVVQRSQDSQSAVDFVAAVNAEGAPTLDGLGKPVAEMPIVEAMEWAALRGIPWEKFLYSNEYDTEFKRFIAEHKRLAFENRKSVHTVR